MSIRTRKDEGRHRYLELAELTEDTVDPEVWGRNFPRQYDSYRRTVDTERTRHGGSEAFSHLEADPRLKRLFAGYAFSLDYREERGHAYMLSDQDETLRVKQVKQFGACLHCHASIIPAYRKAGSGDVMKGFEKVCGLPLPEARMLVDHPVSCLDCHDPKTIQMRVTRPGFLNGIRALADGDAPVPHLPSVERWRKEKGKGKKPYDPNIDATRQEMRSFVCGQCHVENYFKGEGKLVTYPWARGLRVEQIEAYYEKDAGGFKDWTHPETGAAMLKAQHPEFEMWSQGIHARSGVACADCHMPYVREGAMKVSSHHVRSPLLNVTRACQTCHRYPEQEILARAKAIQDRTKALLGRAEDAVVGT
jgi:nitrite reductase (cytochrome c-552)